MKLAFTRISAAVLLTLSSSPLLAADLLDIFHQAVENDPVILAAESLQQADAEIVPQSRSALLPSLTLTANTQTTDREFNGGASPSEERFNSNGYGAQLIQPLFRADRWFNLSAAKATKKQAAASYRDAQQELMLRVATAYFNVLRAEDNLTAAMAREKAFAQQLEQANERFRVGLIPATDVYEAQAGFDLAKVERISSLEARHNSVTTLKSLTNQHYKSADTLDKDMPIADPSPAALTDWIELALANNPQLLAAKHQLEATRQAMKAEKSGHLPTIDARVSYAHSEEGGTSFLGNESDTQVFALELSLPLFEGGNRNPKVREARFRHEKARHDYENSYRQTREQIQTQHRTVTTDVLRVKARQAALRSSEAALEATEGGYDVGTRNIVDVLQAQNNSFDARRNYSNAIYDYLINLLTLKRVAGNLSEEDLAAINQWLVAAPSVANSS
ncbi:Type I secretion outer membrane protein2C TolC precursor [gamma proteobacterium IMCC2047]|nr:Type I secretion outer membrane protein2C TolC precursor [gamma proteobacterium IMCC2047]